MSKPDSTWEYVERYLANPRDLTVGWRRRSVKLVGYRKGDRFKEVANGRVLRERDEEDVVRDAVRRVQ